MMLLRAKKYDPAIQSLNYSISLKPNYGTAYTYRGFAREGLREVERDDGRLGGPRRALVTAHGGLQIPRAELQAREVVEHDRVARDDLRESAISLERLANIERYTLWKGRIV